MPGTERATPQREAAPSWRSARGSFFGRRSSGGAPAAAVPPVEVVVPPPVDRSPPVIVQRALDALPAPAPPPFTPLRDPTIPLLLVVALAGYALVVGRGDRRDPKLGRSSLDPRSRGIGFE